MADLVGVAVVRIGSVDQVHADVERSMDRGDGAGFIRSSLDRHRHAAEPDLADRYIPDEAIIHLQVSLIAGYSVELLPRYVRHCHLSNRRILSDSQSQLMNIED